MHKDCGNCGAIGYGGEMKMCRDCGVKTFDFFSENRMATCKYCRDSMYEYLCKDGLCLVVEEKEETHV